MGFSVLVLIALQSALSSAQQWFGPSNITGSCYYLYGDTQHTFPEGDEICKGLDSPGNENVLNINLDALGWNGGFWLGYTDDDNPNGNWTSMYTGQPLPLDNFHGVEKTVNAYDNYLFTCKYYGWKFGSYWAGTKEFVVCQRYGCDGTGTVIENGEVTKVGPDEYELTCNEGYELNGSSTSGCQCPDVLTLGNCTKNNAAITSGTVTTAANVVAITSATITTTANVDDPVTAEDVKQGEDESCEGDWFISGDGCSLTHEILLIAFLLCPICLGLCLCAWYFLVKKKQKNNKTVTMDE